MLVKLPLNPSAAPDLLAGVEAVTVLVRAVAETVTVTVTYAGWCGGRDSAGAVTVAVTVTLAGWCGGSESAGAVTVAVTVTLAVWRQ